MRRTRFDNLDPVRTEKTFQQFKRWRQERIRKLRNKDYSYTVPNVTPDLEYLHGNRQHPSLTWIGHSTFLIQLGGLNIVTDPVWAGQMAFQRRLAPPGVPIGDMPPVDVVLVSHSHYDHLHIPSLRKLNGPKRLLVPAGLSSKLRLKGFFDVDELNWWESARIGDVRFTFVPAQHWTRRTPWDMNRSHWGGWVMEPVAEQPETARATKADSGRPALAGESGRSALAGDSGRLAPARESDRSALAGDSDRSVLPTDNGRSALAGDSDWSAPAASSGRPVVSRNPTLYFAGDSGYFRGFREIGRRFAIDVAMMPIGAYDPEWFMGPQHVTPEEALQAFEDTGAGLFVPMHYGAFKLADDTPREALDRLEAGRAARGIDEGRIIVLPHGETWRLDGV